MYVVGVCGSGDWSFCNEEYPFCREGPDVGVVIRASVMKNVPSAGRVLITLKKAQWRLCASQMCGTVAIATATGRVKQGEDLH